MSIFINFDGIKGEASDQGHKQWMDVESLSWGVARRITASSSTQNDRESANAEVSSLTVTRRMDSATPKLFLDACCGTGRNVVIHLTKTGTGAGADTYMEYTLKNALIAGYTVDAESQESQRPTEALTISFVDLDMKYTPYDQDGNALAALAVGFDTATNTKR